MAAPVSILLTAKLNKLEVLKDRLRHSSKRLYPLARESAGDAIERAYLPRVRKLAPEGKHYSDEESHPYRDGKPRLGGGLRKAIQIHRFGTSSSLVKVEIANTEDEWGISNQRKAGWVISGRQKRHDIFPKEADGWLVFLWQNAPAEVLARQHSKAMTKRRRRGRKSEGDYPAKLVFFKFVRAGTFKANPFHEKAWDDTKETVKRRLADELKNKITFVFK